MLSFGRLTSTGHLLNLIEGLVKVDAVQAEVVKGILQRHCSIQQRHQSQLRLHPTSLFEHCIAAILAGAAALKYDLSCLISRAGTAEHALERYIPLFSEEAELW